MDVSAENPSKFLTNVASICAFLTRKMPTTALDYVFNIIPAAMNACTEISGDTAELLKLYGVLKEELKGLLAEQQRKEDIKKRQKRVGFTESEELEMHCLEAPEDFRTIEIVPTASELLHHQEPFLRPNKKGGAYDDANHYLDVQFRLYREDFIRPLKLAIRDFRNHR